MKQPPYSIALADDHKLARTALRNILSDEGYDICCLAASGKELIDQLKQAHNLPNLCIVDVNMEPLNGIDTCTAIKQIDSSIKVLAYTMNDDELTRRKMANAGADGFFPKGGSILLLLQTIKSFADDHCNISSVA